MLSEALTLRASGSVVRGLGFKHYATGASQAAVRGYADQLVFENNVIQDNAAQGLSVTGTGVQILRNTVSKNGQMGVHGNETQDLLVEGNQFSENNTENFSVIAAAGGIKVTHSSRPTFRANLADMNNGQGLWLDLGADDATVVHNLSRGNKNAGVISEMSSRSIIASNVLSDNSAGIVISEGSSIQIWNNTLWNNDRGIVALDGLRSAILTDITIRNNVISSGSGSTRPVLFVEDYNYKLSGSDMRVTSNYNAYYRRSTSATPLLASWPDWPAGKLQLSTMSEVRTQTGQELRSLNTENVAVDPYIADAVGGNYGRPLASPAIGAGQPLPLLVAQLLGVAAGVPVDIGALPH